MPAAGASGQGGGGVGGSTGVAGAAGMPDAGAGGGGGTTAACVAGALGWGTGAFAVLSPDSSLVALGSPPSHLEVRRWADDTLVADLSDGVYGVTAIGFSGDGTLIAAADTAGVKVWSVADGSLQTQIAGLASAKLLALSWTGDVIAAGLTGSVSAWQASDPGTLTSWTKINAAVGGLAVSADGSVVAATYTFGAGGTKPDTHVALWSMATGASVWDRDFGMYAGDGRAVFSPDGATIAVSNYYGQVVLLSAATGATVTTVGVAGADPWVYSADGTVIAGTAYLNQTTTLGPALFRVSDGTVLRTYPVPDGGKLSAVGLGPNLAVRSVDVATSSFGLAENGAVVGALPAMFANQGSYVAITPDGRRVATAGASGGITLWDAETLSPTGTGAGSGPMVLGPDGTLYVSSAYKPNASTGVNAIAVSAAGDRLVTGNSDNTASLMTSAGVTLFSLWTVANGHTLPVTAVAFSHDGKTVATGSQDKTVKLWNVADGTYRQTLTGAAAGITAIVFTSDDSRILGGDENGNSGSELRLWNLADGTTLSSKTVGYANDVKLSPDDATVYVAGFTLQRFNLADWSALPDLPGHGVNASINRLALSSDGSRLVSGALDGTGRLHCLP